MAAYASWIRVGAWARYHCEGNPQHNTVCQIWKIQTDLTMDVCDVPGVRAVNPDTGARVEVTFATFEKYWVPCDPWVPRSSWERLLEEPPY